MSKGRGGYNTLLECMQGLPKAVLSYSVQNPEFEDEQQQNIIKLGRYYNIKHIDNLKCLDKMAVSLSRCNNYNNGQVLLNMNGIDNVCNIVMNDIKNIPFINLKMSV